MKMAFASFFLPIHACLDEKTTTWCFPTSLPVIVWLLHHIWKLGTKVKTTFWNCNTFKLQTAIGLNWRFLCVSVFFRILKGSTDSVEQPLFSGSWKIRFKALKPLFFKRYNYLSWNQSFTQEFGHSSASIILVIVWMSVYARYGVDVKFWILWKYLSLTKNKKPKAPFVLLCVHEIVMDH